MSAKRSSASSLRRRLAWTVASLAIIGVVSFVGVKLSHRQARGPAVLALKPPVPDENDALPDEDAKQDATVAPPADVPVDAPPGPKPAGNYHSQRFGYAVSLEGTPWTRWEDLAEVVPGSEWGVLGNFGRLLVIPVSLSGLDPWPEAIDAALLARLSIGYPNDQLTNFQMIDHDGATGHGFRYRREVAGAANLYQLWLLRRGPFAFLFAAWIDEAAAKQAGQEIAMVQLPELLERISFDQGPQSPMATSELSPQQRQSHAAIYNDLGLFAYNARDFNGAAQSFRRAFDLQPEDPAMLMNLINSQIELNQFQPALAELERHVRRFPNQPDLWAARAYLLAETGQIDAAIAAFSSLYGNGYRNEGPFAQYVMLMAKNNRLEEAIAATESFLKAQESFAVRKLQASLYRQRGDNDQAISILTALKANRPFNAELEYDLAECYIAAQQFEDALRTCEELLNNRYDTAHAYLLQARCQFALENLPEAKASLDAALKREPANRDARELLTVVNTALDER